MSEKIECRMQEIALGLHTDSDDVLLDVQGTRGERIGIHLSLIDLAKVQLILTTHLQAKYLAGALRHATARPITEPLHHVPVATLELFEWTLDELTLLISPPAGHPIAVDIPFDEATGLLHALQTFLAKRAQ